MPNAAMQWVARLDLRWRLLIGVALFLTPVLVVQAWNADGERDRAVRDAEQQAASLAQVVDATYTQVTLAADASLAFVVDEASVQGGAGAACDRTLGRIGDSHPVFLAVSVASLDGVITCSGSADRIGLDISDRDYFHRALLTGDTVTSGFMPSRATGEPTVVLATPLQSEDAITGVLIAALDLGWFAGAFAGLDLSPSTSVQLLDASLASLITLTPHPPDGGKAVRIERPLHREASAETVDGYVSVSIPYSEVIGGATARLWRNLITLGGATGVLGLLSFVVVTTTVQAPLDRLVRFTRRLSGGDFTARALTRPVDAPEVVQLAEAMNVSAEALGIFERSLLEFATVDVLTGLPNRAGFVRAAVDSVEAARVGGDRVVFAVVGIRSFTAINATLGFDVGDVVLQRVGERLRDVVGDEGVVARLAGDSFVIAHRVPPGAEESGALISRLHQVLAAPLVVSSSVLRVRHYIGVAEFPEHGDDPDMLIRRAELAARRARDAAQRSAWFDAGRDEPDEEQVHLLSDLQGAIERAELEVHYQPKVALHSGEMSGAEALVRWRRGGEYVSPARFIPIAEQAGMIPDITRAVLTAVVRQLAEWQRVGLEVRTSVNISVLDLVDPDFIDLVAGLLDRFSVPAALLELEITETALLREAGAARAAAEQLRAMGVSLAVDDFGVGFAPLMYLTTFPLHTIKLDRAFIADLATSAQSRTIVEATVAMARGLGLEVVAEGVETTEVADVLNQIGCGHAQGYRFAFPGPAVDLAHYASDAAPPGWLPPEARPS